MTLLFKIGWGCNPSVEATEMFISDIQLSNFHQRIISSPRRDFSVAEIFPLQ
jgi:hypothetical protein